MTLLNAYRTQHLNVTIDDLFFESFEEPVFVCQPQQEVQRIINH